MYQSQASPVFFVLPSAACALEQTGARVPGGALLNHAEGIVEGLGSEDKNGCSQDRSQNGPFRVPFNANLKPTQRGSPNIIKQGHTVVNRLQQPHRIPRGSLCNLKLIRPRRVSRHFAGRGCKLHRPNLPLVRVVGAMSV